MTKPDQDKTPKLERGKSLTIAWDTTTDLPLLFADQLSLLQLNDTIFLVFGQTRLPTNGIGAGEMHGSIEPVARLAIPQGVAKRITAILSEAVSGKDQ